MNISWTLRITLLFIAMAGSAHAGDRMRRPEPVPGARPADAASIETTLDGELRAKFNAATRHSNNLLTAQGAINAGWGFLADRFAEVDSNHDGYLPFSEVETFLDARSPISSVRARAAAKVQVVE